MNLTEVLKQITPCDTNKPYIFVSYSSNDRAVVWPDVLRFQQMGYNVWMDEKNLDKTKASWKQDALKAIEDIFCELVVFYVSKSSLVSKACYNELSCTVGETAIAYHMDPIKFIAIDVEEVGNIGSFTRNLHQSVRMNQNLSKDQKEEMFGVLYHFMKEFFDSNNEKVRIHPKNEPDRKMDYYEEITASFPEIAKNCESKQKTTVTSRTTDKEIVRLDQKAPKRAKKAVSKAEVEQWYQKAQDYNQKGRKKEAFSLYLKAAEQGHGAAQSMAAYYYYVGEVEQDYQKAAMWYEQSAGQGDRIGQNGLACCYYNGKGVEKDYGKAFYWYEKSAEQNVTESMYMTGYAYRYGQGVAENYEKAFYWYQKAAEKNNLSAIHELANCYYNGLGVERDYEKAFYWYEKGAAQNDAASMYMLGCCYYYGNGVILDYEKAYFWYEKSANLGDKLGQNGLGCCYYNGKGTVQDYDAAFYWYEKSALQNCVESIYMLGCCYYYGHGTEQDYKKGFEWFKKAADKNYVNGLEGMGFCYIYGNGVEKNIYLAYDYFLAAKKKGSTLAQSMIDKLKKENPDDSFGE